MWLAVKHVLWPVQMQMRSYCQGISARVGVRHLELHTCRTGMTETMTYRASRKLHHGEKKVFAMIPSDFQCLSFPVVAWGALRSVISLESCASKTIDTGSNTFSGAVQSYAKALPLKILYPRICAADVIFIHKMWDNLICIGSGKGSRQWSPNRIL